MEEQEEIRSPYKIVKQGPFWGILHCKRWVGGLFNDLRKAEAWIERKENSEREAAFNSELRRIKKIPDVRKKMREYKKLCKTQTSL